MSAYDRIYAIVRQIPRGKVATYGQVAELANFPGQGRLVGYGAVSGRFSSRYSLASGD